MKTNQENRLISEKFTQPLIIFKQFYSADKNVMNLKRPLCIEYTDYEKAFEFIEHESIFKALRSIGTHETYVTILEDIYTGAAARVHTDIKIKVSEEIPVLRGVRQGDPISPKLLQQEYRSCLKMPRWKRKE